MRSCQKPGRDFVQKGFVSTINELAEEAQTFPWLLRSAILRGSNSGFGRSGRRNTVCQREGDGSTEIGLCLPTGKLGDKGRDHYFNSVTKAELGFETQDLYGKGGESLSLLYCGSLTARP